MNTKSDSAVQAAKRISELWRAEAWGALASCFSEAIVQVGPHLKELSRGQRAAIESYQVFTSGAKLLEYHEENFRSEVWPGFATTIYEWQMRYVTDGQRRFSRGSDQFIFQESAGQWLAVWRFVDFREDRADP